jgi:hypothetical protein
MPETLVRVEEVLARLSALRISPEALTLLVVPGRDWQPDQIQALRDWSKKGMFLAAHGWQHEVPKIRGIKHRLHSLLISRNVAEHLALDSAGIRDLMIKSRQWFAQQDLPTPDLYVPPAWALGSISPDDLRDTGFSRVETFRGILDIPSGKRRNLPLTGFEADTRFREIAVSFWNRNQIARAQKHGDPLRIGLHPQDFQLRLRDQMRELLLRPWRYLDYGEVEIT